MPTVASVDGVKIQFYWDEHPPPHFHAEYGEYSAMIEIESLEILEGDIPRPQHRKVVAGAQSRKAGLLEAWISCRSDFNPGKIK
ncbi:MAG: DUF4160 domain-containing protein [Xanthobacteraceae bacterium]